MLDQLIQTTYLVSTALFIFSLQWMSDPKTAYARSKVKAERAISALASDRFSPTFLRNGTVYGLSPRMRFDTVLNDLMGSAVANRKVVVYSDGSPWRPVVHIQDVARAFKALRTQ